MWEIIVVFLAVCGLTALCAAGYTAMLFGRHCTLRATIKAGRCAAGREAAMRAAEILGSFFGPAAEIEIEYPAKEGEDRLGF